MSGSDHGYIGVVKKILWVLFGQILIFAQGLIIAPLIIKISGVETYGSYVLILGFIGFIYSFSTFGVTFACRRYLPNTKNSVERAEIFIPQFWFQVSTVLLLSIFGGIIYSDVLAPALKSDAPKYWLIPLYLVTYTVFSQSVDYYRDTHRTGIFALATAIQPYLVIGIFLSLYIVESQLNIEILILSLSCAYGIVGAGLLMKIFQEIGFKISLPKSGELVSAIRFGLPMAVTVVLDTIIAISDKFIIGGFFSVREVGMYVPAYTIGGLVMIFPKVLVAVLLPLMSNENGADSSIMGINALRNSAKMYILISLPYLVGSIILAHDILVIYANSSVANTAYLVLPLVAASSIFNGLTVLKSTILFTRLQTRYILYVNIIVAMVGGLMNILLLSMWREIWVCGLSTLIAYAFGYVIISNKLKYDTLNFVIGRNWLICVMLISLVMGIIILLTELLDKFGIIGLFLRILIGVIIYGLILYIWYKMRRPVEIIDYIKIIASKR